MKLMSWKEGVSLAQSLVRHDSSSDQETENLTSSNSHSPISTNSNAVKSDKKLNFSLEKLSVSNVVKVGQETLHKVVSVFLAFYTMYSLFSLVAWVSHLGARVHWLQPFLIAKGFASNKPVKNVVELFQYNGITALAFILPHTFLRPPKLQQFVGFRYARLLYCAIAGLSCHLMIALFRPINSNVEYQKCYEDAESRGLDASDLCIYQYNEQMNVPLFTLPVPKWTHDILSVVMLFYSFYCVLSDYRTYIILGFNRAYYGANSGMDKFPRELSPRMDIITWMGYCTWLKAGNIGFVLFSGLSILPYKVYTWDIVTRVVAASYLRARSQGFRIWVGQIESTHHFIWIIRAILVIGAISYQMYFNRESESVEVGKNSFGIWTLVTMVTAGIGITVLMDRLEKLK